MTPMKSASLCIVVLSLLPQLLARPVTFPGIAAFEKAPALVVATVEQVEMKEAVSPGHTRSSSSDHYWEATLRIRRSYYNQLLRAGTTITLRYMSYGPSPGAVSVDLPFFHKGNTALFPLKPGGNGRPLLSTGLSIFLSGRVIAMARQSPRFAIARSSTSMAHRPPTIAQY